MPCFRLRESGDFRDLARQLHDRAAHRLEIDAGVRRRPFTVTV